MFDADPVALLAREVLRERAAALVAEACAWTVGTSDRPHHVRRGGRVVPSDLTLGMRAAAGQYLSGDEDAPLELGEARPGSFADALGALGADGRLLAERFDAEVLVPFVRDTCTTAVDRLRTTDPAAYDELLDELGEDGSDLDAVVRAADWEAPLRTEAELLALAALGDVPLVETEAEGLPLSLVRAAEAVTRAAAEPADPPAGPSDDDLAGALFLAEAALEQAPVARPVPPAQAGALLQALLAEDLEADEILGVLPHLPVLADTADAVAALLEDLPPST